MRQTTIWDFLQQESSTEAKPTNQRNIMQFKSLEEVFDYIRGQQAKEPTLDSELTETQHDPEECLDCKLAQLAQLEQLDTLLLANVNVAILEVINNTLNQESPIRNEQADTLLKLTQVRAMLRNVG